VSGTRLPDGGYAFGFEYCLQLTNCTGNNNSSPNGDGFFQCLKMQQNKGTGNTTATYLGSYADTRSSYPFANTQEWDLIVEINKII
jgi:hypothetical protein